MDETQSERREHTGRQENETPLKERRRDRRDGPPLFAYQGPERRSGRDRRASS